MLQLKTYIGAIRVLCNAVGGVNFPGKKRYEGVRFNVISVTRGWNKVKQTMKMEEVTVLEAGGVWYRTFVPHMVSWPKNF